MHLEVTFRNLSPRDEVRRRANSLYSKLERFHDAAAEGVLVITLEHGVMNCELVITALGQTHKIVEEDEDLRTAMDRAFHRIEVGLRRSKERRQDRRRRADTHRQVTDEVESGDDEEDYVDVE